MKRALLAGLGLVLGLVLAGCGAVPWNDQVAAGITTATVEWCHAGDPPAAYICAVEFKDGKEKKNISLGVQMPGGVAVAYSAQGVQAFDGQAVRAAVEKAISGDLGGAAPGLVDRVVGAIMGQGPAP